MCIGTSWLKEKYNTSLSNDGQACACVQYMNLATILCVWVCVSRKTEAWERERERERFQDMKVSTHRAPIHGQCTHWRLESVSMWNHNSRQSISESLECSTVSQCSTSFNLVLQPVINASKKITNKTKTSSKLGSVVIQFSLIKILRQCHLTQWRTCTNKTSSSGIFLLTFARLPNPNPNSIKPKRSLNVYYCKMKPYHRYVYMWKKNVYYIRFGYFLQFHTSAVMTNQTAADTETVGMYI